MVSGAHTDSMPIEDLGNVVRVHVVEHKGDDTTSCSRSLRSNNSQARHLGETSKRVVRDRVLVGVNRLEPDRVQVVDCRVQPNGLGKGGSAGLELPGAQAVDHGLAQHARLRRLDNTSIQRTFSFAAVTNPEMFRRAAMPETAN
jgi:hypothetical protein